MTRIRTRLMIAALAMACVLQALPMHPVAAQLDAGAGAPMQITWEVRNRFRLFSE